MYLVSLRFGGGGVGGQTEKSMFMSIHIGSLFILKAPVWKHLAKLLGISEKSLCPTKLHVDMLYSYVDS